MTVIAYLYHIFCELHRQSDHPDIRLRNENSGHVCETCGAPAWGIWRETAEKEDEQ